MSGKCGEELDKAVLCKSELNINSSVSTTESKDQNQLDSCSVISDWSRTEDDNAESDVGQLMHTLFRKQLYTDVTFCSKTGKESFSAHRAVLAAKCQYFDELLFGDKMKEAKGMEMRVEMGNLPFNIFKTIVEYFYTGEIDLKDVPTVLDIFLEAKHFQIQSIVEMCESYIDSLELTEGNVCYIFQMCNDRNIEELRDRCQSYIQKNTEKVISSEGFQKCIYNTAYIICNLPDLSLKSEEQLVDAVARWVQAHPPHIKPHLIKPLLSNIRLLTLSSQEFGSIIKKHPDIMIADDALKIMIFLNGSLETRSLQNLPSWCNTNTQRRCFKQDNIESALKGTDPKPKKSGKIFISLKPAAKSQEICEQSSLLQIECTKGFHQINAIKISFQSLPPNESIFLIVSVKILQQKTLLNFHKHMTTHSKEKLFEFFKGLKVSAGQVTSIEVKAKGTKPFSLFQLDENEDSLQNEYFQCYVTSKPADKRQFIVSEVLYGPQHGVQFRKRAFQKGVRNKENAKQRKRTRKRKNGVKEEKDIPSLQEPTDEEIATNSEKDNASKEILLCPDTKEIGEESKVTEVKRKETLERSAEARVSVNGNVEHSMISRPTEEKNGKENVKKTVVDDSVDLRNEIPECDREKIDSDQENINRSTLPGKMPETDGKRMMTVDENNGQIILQSSRMKRTEMQEMKDEERTYREKKEVSETDTEKATNYETYGDQMTLSFSNEREAGMKENTKKQEETGGGRKEISVRGRKKRTRDDGKDEPIIVPRYCVKRTGNENLEQKETEKERKDISGGDRKRMMSDEKIDGQIAVPRSSEEKAEKEDANGERKEMSARYQERTMAGDRISHQIALPWYTLTTIDTENLKQRKEILMKKLEILRKKTEWNQIDRGNCDPEMLPTSMENRFERESAKKQEGNDRERKIIPEKDKERKVRDQRHCNQMTSLRLDIKTPNKENKVGDEKSIGTPERHAEVRVNDITNGDHKKLLRPKIIRPSEVEMQQNEGEVKRKELLEKDNRSEEEMNSADKSIFPLLVILFIFILIICMFVK